MGVPGCGKGTQAVALAKNFGYTHISTGSMLRKLMEEDNLKSSEARMLKSMKSGKLVSDKFVYKLVHAEIDKSFQKSKGVVLDGAIRSLRQAKSYQKYFSKHNLGNEIAVIDIHISDQVSLERMMYRKDNSKVVREDDDPKIMKKRIKKQGNKAIKPILNYYEKMGVLKTVNGEQDVDKVHMDIVDLLWP